MVRRRLTRSVSVWSRISCFSAASSSSSSSSSSSASASASSSSSSSSPSTSRLSTAHCCSCSANSGSTWKMSSEGSGSSCSSRESSCVIWSSASTRSRSSSSAGNSANLVLRTANSPSIMYCTRLSMEPSCRTPRKRSKMACRPWGESCVRAAPTSLTKETASSTLSSVGFSRRTVRSWSPRSSCATCWLMRCPMKRTMATQTGLSLRLYERRN
mmetsp:Transcript_58635/g.138167  ORF Transcript_58635/g.138167 Transcript_58635/m.138167 type:complete len:214 (+) Transcript_58635:664-1305(+)